jgi:RNA 2',3'-cyclic 3'-phosphodiesterase
LSGSWFIAFPFPYEAAILDLPPPPPGVRMIAAADLHLTLAFLGRCDAERAEKAFATVDPTAMDRVDVRLGGARLLGPRGRATAIARTLLEGAETLAGYIGAHRDGALVAAGAPADDRDPLPHLTIARIQRRAPREDRKRATSWIETIPRGSAPLRVEHIALYTGNDEPSAPQRYRIVTRCPLGRISV